MKRIVSLILICCLAMALSVGAYAATDYTGGLGLSSATVEQGKTVDVTMSLPTAALATIQFGVSFDTTYLEVTAIDAPGAEELTGFGLYAASDVATANANGLLTFAFVGDKGDNVLQAGAEDVITITFKALKTGTTTISIAGDADMPLIMESLKADGYTPKTQYAPKTSSVTLTIEEPEYIVGDADGNGSVNMFDVLAIRRYLMNATTYPLASVEGADADGNGSVNMFDVLAIRRYLMNPTLYPLGG